ncbi:hypothetical protein [Bifidobacterium sp. ESL0790]|uniref:hypothetical protein n=1 Tax=Bifidobacterium sp. ESL0790 TaxID=2983233 RepID=UPI0023F7DEE1|nr:hypothetical protein [Bifidobacterium sp. ESL0790]WEV71682.1 hypothetical protein OZY47_04205 [Bifidobacterium sp. ESL0790]
MAEGKNVKSNKPVIDVDSQIKVMASHGITFKRCSPEEAKEFLKNHTISSNLRLLTRNSIKAQMEPRII